MEPFTQQFQSPKSETVENFLQTLKVMNISILGRNDELGLVSFENGNKLYYTHFVSVEGGQTAIFISPGLSYMKDQKNDETPPIITKIIKKMEK